MIFLPVLERELRVAARRPMTYRIRLIASGVTLAMLTSFLFRNPRMFGGGMAPGRIAFNALTVLAMIYCLAEGLRSTSDCLSEEKREGTLGLLFLTDLTGHDVVLGKLAATSLNSFYGLLAIIPVLGITLLMGGVTGGEFGRVALVLANSLLLSLSAGLWVSARSDDAYKASVSTLLLLGLLTGGPFAVDQLLMSGSAAVAETPLLLASPAYNCSQAFDAGYVRSRGGFWASLGVIHLLAWFFLWRAGWYLARHHRDEAADSAPIRWRFWPVKAGPAVAPDRRSPKRWFQTNPGLWLAEHFQGPSRFVWVPAFLAIGCALAWQRSAAGPNRVVPYQAFLALLSFFTTIFFYLTLSARACRCFVETRACGILELLACTPLSPRDLVQGQRAALRPLLLKLAFVGWTVQVCSILAQYSSLPPNVLGSLGSIYLLNTIAGMIVSFMDLYALSWVGMWLALKARNLNQAVAKTILLVVVLPWLALIVLESWGASMRSGNLLLSVSPIPILMTIKDVCFIRYARNKLKAGFRHQVSEGALGVFRGNK